MKRRINFYELIFVLLLLICSVIALALSLGFTAKGRAFPLIITVVLMALLMFKLLAVLSPKFAAKVDIQGIKLPEHKDAGACDLVFTGVEEKTEVAAKWPKELMMLFWLALLMALIYLIGFLPTVPIFLFLFLRLQGKHGWLVSIATSLAVLVFVYVLFVAVLSVPFPEGLLFTA